MPVYGNTRMQFAPLPLYLHREHTVSLERSSDLLPQDQSHQGHRAALAIDVQATVVDVFPRYIQAAHPLLFHDETE